MSTGSPMRREELFTLTATPPGPRAPDDLLEFCLTVPNLGGTIVEGIRVRFNLPDLLTIEDGAAVMDVGSLAPGDEQTVRVRARLAPVIASGALAAISAEVIAPHGRIVGSNVVIVRVVSRPHLDGSGTYCSIEPRGAGLYRASLTIENDGDAGAHDLRVTLPAPLGTSTVHGSTSVAGVPVDVRDEDIAIASIDVGTHVVVERDFRMNERFTGEALVLADVRFACSALDPIELPPATCAHREAASIVSCTIDCEPLHSGRRGHVRIRATNAGPLALDDVAVRVSVGNSLSIDRRGMLVWNAPLSVNAVRRPRIAAPRRDERESVVPIGSLAPGVTLDLLVPLDALANCPDQTPARIDATVLVGADTGAEVSAELPIASQPRFTRERSQAAVRVAPADGLPSIVVTVLNDGTTRAQGVYLDVSGAAAFDGTPERTQVALGDIDAGSASTVTIAVRPLADAPPGPASITATLRAENADALVFEPVTVPLRAYPLIEATAWIAPLEPDAFAVTISNRGSAAAHDVVVTLDGGADIIAYPAILMLGTIAAGETQAATITVDDRRKLGESQGATLEATLTARGGIVRRLDPYAFDQPRTAIISDAIMGADTADAIAGETIVFACSFNVLGPGRADRLAVRLMPTPGARYVDGSTAINRRRVIDGPGATGSIDRGIVLRNVTPQEIAFSYSLQIAADFADGGTIAPTVCIDGGAEPAFVCATPTIVHAKPTLPVQPTDLSFALEGVALAGVAEVAESLPAFTANEEPSIFAAPARAGERLDPPNDCEDTQRVAFATALGMGDRSAIVRYLRAADVPGIVRHLVALRVLVAGARRGATATLNDAVACERSARKAVLDRLLIKLRIPGFSIEPGDGEDRASRAALVALALAACAEPPADAVEHVSQAHVSLTKAALRSSAEAIATAPRGSTEPFVLLARLIGTDVTDDTALTAALRAYRDRLLETLQDAHTIEDCAASRELDDALAEIVCALDEPSEAAA